MDRRALTRRDHHLGRLLAASLWGRFVDHRASHRSQSWSADHRRRSAAIPAPSIDLYYPAAISVSRPQLGLGYLNVIGRLRNGIDPARAQHFTRDRWESTRERWTQRVQFRLRGYRWSDCIDTHEYGRPVRSTALFAIDCEHELATRAEWSRVVSGGDSSDVAFGICETRGLGSTQTMR